MGDRKLIDNHRRVPTCESQLTGIGRGRVEAASPDRLILFE